MTEIEYLEGRLLNVKLILAYLAKQQVKYAAEENDLTMQLNRARRVAKELQS